MTACFSTDSVLFHQIIDLCLKFIAFDPNYNYGDNDDDQDDFNDENSMELDNINSEEK